MEEQYKCLFSATTVSQYSSSMYLQNPYNIVTLYIHFFLTAGQIFSEWAKAKLMILSVYLSQVNDYWYWY